MRRLPAGFYFEDLSANSWGTQAMVKCAQCGAHQCLKMVDSEFRCSDTVTCDKLVRMRSRPPLDGFGP